MAGEDIIDWSIWKNIFEFTIVRMTLQEDGHILMGLKTWGYAKTRLSKHCGIHKISLYFHLKESEFRFNYRHGNIYQTILENFRNKPLN
jgi:transposase-like protein